MMLCELLGFSNLVRETKQTMLDLAPPSTLSWSEGTWRIFLIPHPIDRSWTFKPL
jgi:hypothetical protein